jgi:hypothetical protein
MQINRKVFNRYSSIKGKVYKYRITFQIYRTTQSPECVVLLLVKKKYGLETTGSGQDSTNTMHTVVTSSSTSSTRNKMEKNIGVCLLSNWKCSLTAENLINSIPIYYAAATQESE